MLGISISTIKEKVIRNLHNDDLGGHLRRDKTHVAVEESFYWPH